MFKEKKKKNFKQVNVSWGVLLTCLPLSTQLSFGLLKE